MVTSDRLEELKMHESIRASMNVDVQRVPGGLIYWQVIDRLGGNSSCAVSGVFVPFTTFKVKDAEYF